MEENTYEISIMELIGILLHRWYIILGLTLLGIGVSFIYAYYVSDETYIATSSMIVQAYDANETDAVNLLTGQRLVDTYKEVSSSNKVLLEVIDRLELNLTIDQLRQMISVEGLTNTIIVEINVETTSPELSAAIANEIVYVVQELSIDFVILEDIEILDVALIPNAPSGPNKLLILVMGLMLGGILGVGSVLAIEFLNTNIKSISDVENYLQLRIMGMIPEYEINEV